MLGLSMHELQQLFRRNIFNQTNDLSFISSNFPQERFDLYRQTIVENMTNALRITYSGVWKLLGDACANSVAYTYSKIDKNLPKTGCLDDFGEGFANFLATLKELSQIPYLRDYAHYEWLKHLAYIAKDSSSIIPSDLMNIPEDKIDHINFHFRPSVYMFQSQYPLFDVHEIVQDTSAKTMTLKREDSYGVINRTGDEINTYWITNDHWHFIKKLSENGTLLESSEYAQKFNKNFELSSAIAFILQAELVEKLIDKGGNNAH